MARRSALVLLACLVLAAPAAGDNSGKLSELRAKIEAARAKESRLTSQIHDVTTEIRALEGRVGDVTKKLSVLEHDLALHQRRLDRLNELFVFETHRLNFLRREYEHVVTLLNRRLVDIYESNNPSTVEVVLNSDSFQDALETLHYLQSIARQDKQIAREVGIARDEVKRSRERTKKTRAHVHQETQVIAVRTYQERTVRNQLVSSRNRLSSARARKRSALATTREQERDWIAEADALAASDARVRSALSGSSAPADTVPSSRGLIWPAAGPVTSPFGYRWGRLHAGIDIGAPYGAPIHAAASGVVVLAGWTGGYGNYTCIDHGGGLGTCYGHQSSFAVSSGQSVAQGQVIGYVGNTGHSTGPHLHFEVRINGTPVDPLGYL
jgi:murein DD-endopeptidase MepM/ murein hydrolase activator NlpD